MEDLKNSCWMHERDNKPDKDTISKNYHSLTYLSHLPFTIFLF